MVAEGGTFGDRVRALVIELWQRTRLDWGFVSDRLSVTFRRERSLGSNERRFVAETVYGMVRHLRRIDAAVGAGAGRTAPTAHRAAPARVSRARTAARTGAGCGARSERGLGEGGAHRRRDRGGAT